MSRTGFLVFAGLTAILAVAAFLTYPGAKTWSPASGAAFFPALDGRDLSKMQEVKVVSGTNVVTAYRKGGQWVIKELHDYPADIRVIRAAIVGLTELRQFEQKTADKKRFGILDLEDAEAKGASSIRLTVTESGGGKIADIIVGRANNAYAILGRDMVYVRRPGQDQAWLAIGDPKLKKDKLDWVEKRLLTIDPKRVKRVVLERDGKKIEVVKAKPGDKEFTLATLPEGRKAKQSRLLEQLAELANEIDIYDVQPLAKVDFKKDPAGTLRLETFDGLVVTATLATENKKLWAQYSVSVDEKALLKDKPKKDSPLKAAADVRKEVAEIGPRLKQWAYLPPVWARRTMKWSPEDVLVALPKKKPEPKKPELKKTEPKKTEPKKPEEKKTEVKKPAPAKPADTKPADTKPAETKPADTKPAENKPEDKKPEKAE